MGSVFVGVGGSGIIFLTSFRDWAGAGIFFMGVGGSGSQKPLPCHALGLMQVKLIVSSSTWTDQLGPLYE